MPNALYTNMALIHEETVTDATYPALNYDLPENPYENPTPVVGSNPPSSITTPSGKYKVYVNSQGNILSGVGQ